MNYVVTIIRFKSWRIESFPDTPHHHHKKTVSPPPPQDSTK